MQRKKHIKVVYAPGSSTESVVEITLAMMVIGAIGSFIVDNEQFIKIPAAYFLKKGFNIKLIIPDKTCFII